MTPLYKTLRRLVWNEDNCWIWQGARNREGYGVVQVSSRTWLTHRFAYTKMVGPIPDGLTLDHVCRARACANPRHLEPVSSRENFLRSLHPSAVRYHADACPNGHPFDEDNTLRDGTRRRCRTCTNARRRADWSRRYNKGESK